MKQSRDAKKNTSRREWFRKHGFSAVLYVLAGVVALGLVGDAVAKYFQTSSDESLIQANWFYFNSDMTEGSPHTLSPGATSITFSVTNSEDSLRVAETDIEYEVSVEPALGADGIEYGNPNKRLAKGTGGHDLVTLSNLQPGTTYTVTVTGTAAGAYPADYTGGKYSKTLTFKLIIPAENALYTHFEKKDGYVLLTVWAQGYQGTDVKISYPDDVVPDNTSPIAAMQSALAGPGTITDGVTFKDSAYASAGYRFFITSGTPTAESFEVTYAGTKIAKAKIPG